MEGLFTLLALSIVMAITSFIVGSLPLAFALSPSQLRLISSIGTGVLVGTSLIVIIPEGVETLYSANSSNRRKDVSTRSTPINWQHQNVPVVAAATFSNPEASGTLHASVLAQTDLHNTPLNAEDERAVYVTRDDPPTEDSNVLQGRKEGSSNDKSEKAKDEEDDVGSPHAWIGIALITGFILMYLIDKLPDFASPKPPRPPYHISLDNLGSGLRRSSSPSREGGLLASGGSFRRSHSVATTTGLVIHAAADGIALGASSSNTGLSFIIFLAIMVHKAPASFGLTSVLLKQGLTSRSARTHLLVFSLSAPIGAIATFLFVQVMGSGASEDEAISRWRTGMLLLFSAGTFLYVAMHTMQENGPDSTSRESQVNGYGDARDGPPKPDRPMRDLIASVIGMILPLFLQIGHAH
ncbi:ZIP metal ion transporter [Aspergillus sclerotialis]|uniref:ZIP metal ion transporter n=1 Tax=Aspergillus sclerotialis TaxID=2070753 RepID=A0A3A2ZIW5_9EURO|nr:ZIP metal ion transporter [Aspergillus sclerotialis]